MSTAAGLAPVVAHGRAQPGMAAPTRLLLLGSGTVGSAFVQRYLRLRERGLELPVLAQLANSRARVEVDADPLLALERLRAASPAWQAPHCEPAPGDIVVDATASEAVAAAHPQWLARGVHVVTANKLGRGGPLPRARAVAHACAASGAAYGDSATVGAGLPLLASVRALLAGGDRIHALEGVLSGSLAWLCNQHDGRQPFSALVAQAAAAGYTEPDPRIDLSGEDVRRKLLILARSAGLELEAGQVRVESLVPPELAACGLEQARAGMHLLDAPLAAALEQARREGGSLRFVGRFDRQGVLAPGHPLAAGAGTDNRVAIHSDRYSEQPLLIQGPGAGAGVTAAALLDDVLAVARRRA